MSKKKYFQCEKIGMVTTVRISATRALQICNKKNSVTLVDFFEDFFSFFGLQKSPSKPKMRSRGLTETSLAMTNYDTTLGALIYVHTTLCCSAQRHPRGITADGVPSHTVYAIP